MYEHQAAQHRPVRRQPGLRDVAGRLRASRGRSEAFRVFFPGAMLDAAIMLPLTLGAMAFGVPAGLASGPAHGAEMLAGFALAVITGFLLPPQPKGWIATLLGLWIVGRIAAIQGLPGLWAATPTIVFAAIVMVMIVPKLTRAAKKLRNKATGPLAGLIAGFTALAAALVAAGSLGSALTALYTTIAMLAGLMLFMGGRIIAASGPAALRRQGERVPVRVQPRLEGVMLACFIPVVAGLTIHPLHWAAALGVGAAGIISLIRLARWRLWRCRSRTDLWGLGPVVLSYGAAPAGIFSQDKAP